jgi:hypothetical protein
MEGNQGANYPLNNIIQRPIPFFPGLFVQLIDETMGGDILEASMNDDLPDKPAKKEFINSLQEITVDQEMFDKELQCSICLDKFQIGDKCIELPCENPHFFHTGDNKEVCEGVKPWFQLNHNCPVCRHSFPEEPDQQSEETTENSDDNSDDNNDEEGIENLLMNRFNHILRENPIERAIHPPIRMNAFIDRVIEEEEDRQLQEAIRLSLENS